MPLTKGNPLLRGNQDAPSSLSHGYDRTYNNLRKYPSGLTFEDDFDASEPTFHFHRNLQFSEDALLDSVRTGNSGTAQVRMIEIRLERAQEIVERWQLFEGENKFRHVQKLKGTCRLKCEERHLFVLLFEPTPTYDLRTYLTLLEKYDPQHSKPCGTSMFVISEAMGCVAYTLAQMHSLGIAHNAIRPENILIEDNRVLFGLEFRPCEPVSRTFPILYIH